MEGILVADCAAGTVGFNRVSCRAQKPEILCLNNRLGSHPRIR